MSGFRYTNLVLYTLGCSSDSQGLILRLPVRCGLVTSAVQRRFVKSRSTVALDRNGIKHSISARDTRQKNCSFCTRAVGLGVSLMQAHLTKAGNVINHILGPRRMQPTQAREKITRQGDSAAGIRNPDSIPRGTRCIKVASTVKSG